MTLDEVIERLEGSDYAMYPGGAIRTKVSCVCPLERLSGLGRGNADKGARLLGLDQFDSGVVMSAADRSLDELKRHHGIGAKYRFRLLLLKKIREANGGVIPRARWPIPN